MNSYPQKKTLSLNYIKEIKYQNYLFIKSNEFSTLFYFKTFQNPKL